MRYSYLFIGVFLFEHGNKNLSKIKIFLKIKSWKRKKQLRKNLEIEILLKIEN
jgi:hypothetical protein